MSATEAQAPSRGYWHCCYWCLIGCNQSIVAKAKCLLSEESCVRVSWYVTNSNIEISEVRVQLPECLVTAHLCMTVYVQLLGKWLVADTTYWTSTGKTQSFSWGIFVFCRIWAPQAIRVQPCWFAVYQWRAEKGWLMRWLALLPHMLALCLSQTENGSAHTCHSTPVFWGLWLFEMLI